MSWQESQDELAFAKRQLAEIEAGLAKATAAYDDSPSEAGEIELDRYEHAFEEALQRHSAARKSEREARLAQQQPMIF